MAIDKLVDPNFAASLYAKTSAAAAPKTPGDEGASFSKFLTDGIGQAIDTIKIGEQKQAQAVTGDADLTDVVQAATSAELTLQTIVAIRDKLVGAYQQIMQMPI